LSPSAELRTGGPVYRRGVSMHTGECFHRAEMPVEQGPCGDASLYGNFARIIGPRGWLEGPWASTTMENGLGLIRTTASGRAAEMGSRSRLYDCRDTQETTTTTTLLHIIAPVQSTTNYTNDRINDGRLSSCRTTAEGRVPSTRYPRSYTWTEQSTTRGMDSRKTEE